MVRKLWSALAVLAVVFCLASVATQAGATEQPTGRVSVDIAQAETVRLGPYATIRRANEVANQYRSLGYRAGVVPEWGDYFVYVW